MSEPMPADPNPMPRWSNLWGREPVLVVAFVQAVIALVAAFGLDLTGDQVSAIVVVTAAALSLVVRHKVSPNV